MQLVALPWSWFIPRASSYPIIAEIEGSRIILKNGIYGLATADLIAWWPFLVLSLFFYGLLLRLAFTVFGRLLEERALARLDFDNAACLTVLRRMRTPLFSTQAAPEVQQLEHMNLSESPDDEGQTEGTRLLPQVMLIPDDIFGLCPTDKLVPLMRDRGFAIKSVHTFMTGYDEDEEIKNILITQCRTPEDGLFILMEGWMPPLVAFITYLKELRRNPAGKNHDSPRPGRQTGALRVYAAGTAGSGHLAEKNFDIQRPLSACLCPDLLTG